MRRDINRFLASKITKFRDFVCCFRQVSRRRVVYHDVQNRSLLRFMAVEVCRSVPGAVKESGQTEYGPAAQQNATRPGILVWKVDLNSTASAASVIPQAPGLAQHCDDHQRPSGISDNACPTDNTKRAVSQANIMNQKDTEGKEYAASDKKDSQQFLSRSGERDIRLQHCEKQRQVPGVDHMNMRVHLGTSVFQCCAKMLEYILHCRRILRRNLPRSGNQQLTLLPGIRM